MNRRDWEIYSQGFIDGLESFAWSNNGEMFVGTCGVTLKQAIKLFEQGMIWNQAKQLDDLALGENNSVRSLWENTDGSCPYKVEGSGGE